MADSSTMALDPTAAGRPSAAHVSLTELRTLRRGIESAIREVTTPANAGPFRTPPRTTRGTAGARASAARAKPEAANLRTGRAYDPHTPVQSNGSSDPDRWDSLLNRLGQKHNVPPVFLKAVMLAESGGRPDAVGDSGHSVGLFQLHDQGYGAGMGDSRYDPETNAERGTRGLAEAWHAGERKGLGGEYAVRAAYDYSFNPGGGFAYQGDAIVRYYNQLLAEQGQPPLA